MATTETPIAQVDEFALLTVVDVNEQGAFLDMGIGKDVFVPGKGAKEAHADWSKICSLSV